MVGGAGERVGCPNEAMIFEGEGKERRATVLYVPSIFFLITSFFDSLNYHNPDFEYNICVVKYNFFDELYSFMVFDRSSEPLIQKSFFATQHFFMSLRFPTRKTYLPRNLFQ